MEIEMYVWLGVLLLGLIVEAATLNLTSVWFAAGALVALLTAVAGGMLWLQILLFLLATGLSIWFLRPLAQRLRKGVVATNADRVVGQLAIVTEPVDRFAGAAHVDGKEWTARCDTETPLAADTRAEVLRIEGVKLILAPQERS